MDSDKPKALFEYEWGWNDPPSVSYQDRSSGAGKKPSSVLQQRVPYPVGSQSSATGRQPASTLSQSTAPPTVSYLGTKPPPTSTASGGIGTAEERDQCQSQAAGEEESAGVPSSSPSLSNVSTQLEAALEECSHKLQGRAVEEVKKKLDLFSTQWSEGRLSLAVQQKMQTLAAALADKEYQTAYQLHVSLMVDHAGEVSQWMVAIKRIISTLRQLES